jgi:hypothetical protein
MESIRKQVSPVTAPQDVTPGEVVPLPSRELDTLAVDGVDPIFEAQAKLINHSVQCIGMGKVGHLTYLLRFHVLITWLL